MPEVYTCKCGGQTWQIHGRSIMCTKCNQYYKPECHPGPEEFMDNPDGYELESAKEFNENEKERQLAED